MEINISKSEELPLSKSKSADMVDPEAAVPRADVLPNARAPSWRKTNRLSTPVKGRDGNGNEIDLAVVATKLRQRGGTFAGVERSQTFAGNMMDMEKDLLKAMLISKTSDALPSKNGKSESSMWFTRAGLNPIWLNFRDANVEKEFLSRRLRGTLLLATKIALIAGILFFGLLVIGKAVQLNWTTTFMLERIMIFSFLFVLPALGLLGFILFLKDIYTKYWGTLVTISWILMETSTVAAVVIICGAFSIFIRPCFPYSCISLSVVMLDYFITAVSSRYDRVVDLLMSIGFILAAVVVFLFGIFSAERNERKSFFLEVEAKRENQRLKITVRRMVEERERARADRLDLETPFAKIMGVLKTLKGSPALAGPEHDLLIFIERVLYANKSDLFRPNIRNQLQRQESSIDDETKQWLLSEVTRENLDDRLTSVEEKRKKRQSRPLDSSLEAFGRRPTTELMDEAKLIEGDEAVNEMLENILDWNFDIFTLHSKVKDRTLSTVAIHIFERFDLFSQFEISKSTFQNFIFMVEKGYRNNPYHNSLHAADILITSAYFLNALVKDIQPIEILSVLFAAIIHDVGHPGLNNNFIVSTKNALAMVYNDKSPLENHHLSTAFRLMSEKSEANIFKRLSDSDYRFLRSLVIEMVLATDMAYHFELLSKFEQLAEDRDGMFSIKEPKDRTLVFQMLLKAADVSNVTKPKSHYLDWTERVMNEFYLQGDNERNNGLKVSAFMDRRNPNVIGCQKGFMDFICCPLFAVFSDFIGDRKPMNCLKDNKELWNSDHPPSIASQRMQAIEEDDDMDSIPSITVKHDSMAIHREVLVKKQKNESDNDIPEITLVLNNNDEIF